MTQPWRTRLRRTTVAVALLSTVALAAPAAAHAGGPPSATAVTGTLLVAPAEAAVDTPEFAVRTDDGTLVALDAPDLDEGQAGSNFSGEVALPDRYPSGAAGLQEAERDRVALRVVSATLTPAAPSAAITGATHRWYAAAPSNFGALDQSDSALLDQIGQMAGYWEAQANGDIADIVPPSSIVRYTATATTTAAGCGLTGGDFWATVSEAASQFPGFGSGDQLLLLMPSSCNTGGVAGRGSVAGLSFANGGYTISRHTASIFKQTLAHELGHNYGYGHARLGPCTTACVSEYGDYYSVMGAVVGGYPQPTALATPYRLMQGITDAGEVETLLPGDTPATYTRTLSPRSATSGLRSLAFSDPSTGRTVYVDYRSGTGADAGAYYAAGSAGSAFRPGVTVEEVFSSTGIALVPDGSTKALVAGESRTLAGGEVTVAVTAMGGGSATVEVTLPGLPAYPTPGTLTVSGTPQVGRPLTVTLSGQSPSPTGVSYQWRADGSPIAGGTGPTYVPGPAQVGAEVTVAVTVSAPGYAPATLTSSPVLVAPGQLVVTAPPVVTGVVAVGRTLACDGPTLSVTPPGLHRAVSWRRDGVLVDGATGAGYVAAADDLGGDLSCSMVLSAPGYTDASTTSAAVGPVAEGTLRSHRPVVKGKPVVGRRLRAVPGTWTDGVTFRYRWFVGGERLRAQRAARLKVKGWMVGKRVKLKLVGTLAGYTAVTRGSRPRGPVRRA